MGLNLFSSCSHQGSAVDRLVGELRSELAEEAREGRLRGTGNPHPRRFRILRAESVGSFTIAEILYPDCRNYEGKKILVFESIGVEKLKALSFIDPHFCDSDEHPSPIARFEPTKKGWRLALTLAKNA